MDPSGLANPQWNDIGNLLTSLWIVAAFVFSFALNMLVGHIMIPSLVSTLHLHPVVHRARPFFYFGAIVSLVVAVLFALRVVGLGDVLATFWDDYWI